MTITTGGRQSVGIQPRIGLVEKQLCLLSGSMVAMRIALQHTLARLRNHNVIVLGLGPAGMAVSAMAAEMGLRVAASSRARSAASA
jgi:phosphoglycerate dehydrogenase-like enzyme